MHSLRCLAGYCAVLVIAVVEAIAASNPVMFRGNPLHTGVYDSKGKFTTQKERWRFKTGNVNRSTPAVADGVVYVGSHSGDLFAIDAASGELKWKYQTGGEISSSPAVAEGLVFVNNDAGFYALEAASGREKWVFKTGAPVPFAHRWDYFQSSPAWVDGVTFFGSADGYIYALKSATGELVWKFKTDGRVRSSPAIVEDVVYCGSMDGNLYALDAKSGSLKWKFKTAGNSFFPLGEVQSSPAVGDGAVYFGSRDGNLYAVEIATGEKRWAFSHDGSWCISSPAVWEGMVFAGSSDGQFVNAVDAKTGKEVWRFKMPSRVFTSGAIANGEVYFGSWGGEVDWLDAKTGKQRGGTMAEAAVQGSPVVADGVLYFASDDGYVYAVELQAPRTILATPVNPALLEIYAGRFEMGADFKVTITHQKDKLLAEILGMGNAELVPLSETRFAIGDSPAELEFVREPDGSCKRAVLRQGGFEATLARVP